MNEFDNILKNKLESYREMPSQDVFLKIRSQYPKPGITSFINKYKYYFIAAVSTVIIISGIFVLNSIKKENNKISTTENKSFNIDGNLNVKEYPNNNNDNLNEDINELVSNQNNIVLAVNFDKSIVSNSKNVVFLRMFDFVDTVICGTLLETKFNGVYAALNIPEGIKAVNSFGKLRFFANKPGNYTIYYCDNTDDKLIKDSVQITFKNVNNAEISLSDENLCPGEDLLVTINNYSSEPIWEDNLIVSKKLGSAYHVSGLKNGNNTIAFTISDNGCSQSYKKVINVSEPISYDYTSTPNICSGANASLIISTENKNVNAFILNNTIESKNGIFKGLNSGIYTLSINYDNGCVVRDTLLIIDSLNLSPYFIAEKDLLNKNKYSFRNLSKVDDKGYERNPNVEFIWKIDGDIISTEDNPVYEFNKEGIHRIEIITVLSETCQNIYSETISISGSNFRIPNIFTPNGDGIGDDFIVVYEGDLAVYKLDIVNRAGEVVFESSDIARSWNGKINGNDDAVEGLYYYIIRGEDKFGNKIEQKGSLQLVRH